MVEKFDVVIIGGGASGLFLASQLPRRLYRDSSRAVYHELSVAIVECNERVGKKLLATGNGKCNLTNHDMSAEHYNNPGAVKEIIENVDAMRTVSAFAEMGLLVKEIDKRVYPYSECASSVLDALRRAVDKNGTHIFTSHCVDFIAHKNGVFEIGGAHKLENSVEEFKLLAKNVVLATGSPATFGRYSLGLYGGFGHTVHGSQPSLVPIKTEREPIKGLQGVRVKATVSIGDRRETGEVLFKDFGVSGIAVFNLSAELARGRAHVGDTLSIDFMPEYELWEIEDLLHHFDRDNMTVSELLAGVFHNRVGERIIDMAGCKPSDKARDKRSALAKAIKHFDLKIEGLGDKSLAQVMSGGLNMDEFDENLMSKKVSGAYAVGEALDIDGDCGGYNLQWAWSSAYTVAAAILETLRPN